MTDKRARRLIKHLDSAMGVFEKITLIVIYSIVLGLVAWLLSPVTMVFGDEIGEKIFTGTMFFGCGMVVMFTLVSFLQSIFCGRFYLERLISRHHLVAVALKRRRIFSTIDRTLHIFLEDFPEKGRLEESSYDTDFKITLVGEIITLLSPGHFRGPGASRTTSVIMYVYYEFGDLKETLATMIESGRLNLDELAPQLKRQVRKSWYGLKVWSTPFSNVPSDFLASLRSEIQEVIIPNVPTEVAFKRFAWKYAPCESDDD